VTEETERKIDELIYQKIKKLLSWQSIKEFFLFLLLVSISIIALDEAQKRLIDYSYVQTCVQTIKNCNGTYAVSCGPMLLNLNYSSFSPNSSFNVSSSS
jgi:hypothetical protein